MFYPHDGYSMALMKGKHSNVNMYSVLRFLQDYLIIRLKHKYSQTSIIFYIHTRVKCETNIIICFTESSECTQEAQAHVQMEETIMIPE